MLLIKLKIKVLIMKIRNFIVLAISQIIVSCAIIRPGEVGIKQKLGKFSDKVVKEGTVI